MTILNRSAAIVASLLLGLIANISVATPTSTTERKESWKQHLKLRNESLFNHLKWRSVGPRKQGGRIESIAVPPGINSTIYVGVGSGNVWKTVNNGITWIPVFENESTFTIGDVAVAPSDPNVVWVGTGEELMARSSYAGTGVFKSTDAGETWRNMGLEDTHHIGQVLIDPQNPDIVYVAAIGHLYSDNEQRGVFKTTDGGSTWERILHIDARTGAIDLVMDPADNNTIYATTWQHERKAWGHIAYGPGSGIYKSADAGDSWQRLTDGLPTGEDVGRIALDVARSNPNVLYALVDSRAGNDALYRSNNKGKSWITVNEDKVRAGYDFCMVRVCPNNPDEVYLPGQRSYVSRDGGKTYEQIGGTLVHLFPHGSKVLHLDAHAFWIDPLNTDRIILGNDGGLHLSYDRCKSWLHMNNMPIGEFYAVWADNDTPYNIFGGTQDNAALFGPSDHHPADNEADPWQQIYLDRWGGGDSYFTYPDPTDPSTIYYEHQFGDIRRKNMQTGKSKGIRPSRGTIMGADRDEDKSRLRFNWMTPFFISRYKPSTLYYGANKLFKSVNRGDTWSAISPDLSTKPGPEKQGNVPYGTITTLSESPVSQGLLYAGTDDGNLHVTEDDGQTWTQIDDQLPDKWISRVVASQHDRATVYVTLTGYREDDFSSHVYRSIDYGQNWTSIAANLPPEPINVIREDPTRRGILYLGTDLGAYASIDDGAQWQSITQGLPTAAVSDLFVHAREGELVASTHGRSIYVLDVKRIQTQDPKAQELKTVAEQTDYRATASSAAVVEFVDNVASQVDHISRFEFGRTVENRPMVGAVVAAPHVTDPDQLKSDDRLVILINANIHSGECSGKEATLRMLRELSVRPDHPWLKRLVLIFVPNYNADGNDRVARNNRRGQIGPVDGMGIRRNAQGLDLNREYMKLASPEARALVALTHRWDADCFIDLHTPDGSWHQYELTYDVQHNPAADAGLDRFLRDIMMPKVSDKMVQRAFQTFYYGNFNRDNTAWYTTDHKPRFGMDYNALCGRLSILSEAYSYIPFQERIEATHAFVEECLDFLGDNSTQVTAELNAVRDRTVEAGKQPRSGDLVPIRARIAPFAEKFTVKAYDPPRKPRVAQEDIVHGVRPTPPGLTMDYSVDFYGRFEPTLDVQRPFAYLIPADQQQVIENLRLHGLIMTPLSEDTEMEIEVYRWVSLEKAERPFEDHRIAAAEVTSRAESRTIPSGTYKIETGQPLGNLLVYLLEPQSDDGLVAWNFFDDQFAKGKDFPILRVLNP